MSGSVIDIEAAAGLITRVREMSPLIHNITNNVVLNSSADAILAVGATQATVHNTEEARELASIASAISINLGTPSGLWAECARTAIAVAVEQAKPWVLDPVAVGLLPYRTDLAHECLAAGPTVVKGNASEIMAFAGEDAKTHGADSMHDTEQAAAAAVRLAADSGTIVAATGAVDLITDGKRTVRIANGNPLMPATVGTGCMLTPVIAAFVAVTNDAFSATVAAIAAMGIAGELAAEKAEGPGTLRPLLIDALYGLNSETLTAKIRIS